MDVSTLRMDGWRQTMWFSMGESATRYLWRNNTLQCGLRYDFRAMILATKGAGQNPSSLDIWLTDNGGYADGVTSYIGEVSMHFGVTSFQGIETANESDLYVRYCYDDNGFAPRHAHERSCNQSSRQLGATDIYCVAMTGSLLQPPDWSASSLIPPISTFMLVIQQIK